MKFAIYHREREYAREMGDPQLTEVEAATKEEAERLTAHLGLTGTLAVPVVQPCHPQGIMANHNRRSNFLCSVATTTGYFATQNAAGITEIHSGHIDKTHKIPAYGQLTFWSCAGPTSASPAGQITILICPGNHLTTLSVSGLPVLRELDCSFNDLASLKLSGLPSLESLVLTKNRLASLDVRALSRLKTLSCYGNLLTSLDLTGLDRLQTLDCSMNQLVSLKLGGCKSLHTIYAYRNQISPLELSDVPALRECHLGSGQSGGASPDTTGITDGGLACHDGPLVFVHPSEARALAESDVLSAAKYISPRARPLTAEEADVRAIAYALKKPTSQALAIAAPAMAALISGPCWLVPIPASDTSLTANLALAGAIAALVPGARVKLAIARSCPVESSTACRRRGEFGLRPEEHHLVRTTGPMAPLPLYFVDNVITTGNTVRAARSALGWGTALTYADASSPRNTRPSQHLGRVHYNAPAPIFYAGTPPSL